MIKGFLLAATAAMLISPVVASATTLPASFALTQVTLTTGNPLVVQVNNGPASLSYALSGPNSFSEAGSATEDTTHGIAIANAEATTSANPAADPLGADAFSAITIYFDIHGPAGPVSTTLESLLNYSFIGNPYYASEAAEVVIYRDVDDLAVDTQRVVCNGTTGSIPCLANGGMTTTSDVTLQTNTRYRLYISAGATAYSKVAFGPNVGNVAAGAYAVPYLSIDPNQAGADLYSFEFSDGFVNAPIAPVPEPSAWTMMFLGFGVAGLTMRRHQRATRRVSCI